jgi:hypothetical protein
MLLYAPSTEWKRSEKWMLQRPKMRWEDDIKINLMGTSCDVDGIGSGLYTVVFRLYYQRIILLVNEPPCEVVLP